MSALTAIRSPFSDSQTHHIVGFGKQTTFSHIARKYVEKTEGAKTVADFISTLTAWPSMLSKKPVKLADKTSHATGNIRNFMSILQTPSSIKDFMDSFKKRRAVDVLSTGSGLINNVCDGIDFLNGKIGKASSSTMGKIGVVNSAATCIGATIGATREIHHISKLQKNGVDTARDGHRLRHALMELVKCVSYAAFGALGIAAAFFSVTVAPWIPLACLTTGVTLTISSHFYKKSNSL